MVNYANFLRFTSSKTLVFLLWIIWKKSPFFGDSSHTISSIKLKGTTTNNQNLPTRWIPRCCCGCCGGYCGAAGGGAYCCMALGKVRPLKNHRRRFAPKRLSESSSKPMAFWGDICYRLVVESTHLKNMLVKLGSSSPNRGENKKYFLTNPTPTCWVVSQQAVANKIK